MMIFSMGEFLFVLLIFFLIFFVLFRDWPSFQKTENIAWYLVKLGGTRKKQQQQMKRRNIGCSQLKERRG